MESTLRPWLAISKVEKIVGFRTHLEISIKNHGRIPAKVVRSQYVLSATEITQEQIRSGKEEFHGFMIFPDTGKRIILKDQISINTPYVGIIINYEYATNKKAEFGLTAKYDQMGNEFIHLEVFAN
jgi:hypothetical protein